MLKAADIPAAEWPQTLLRAALWLPLLLIVYAAYEDILLFLDASYYLYLNLLRQDFALLEPSSRSVQFLQQLPVLGLIWLQVENLDVLKFVAGGWNLFLPLGLTALSYAVLPAQAKHMFVFPLAAYVAGALVSFFPTVTDAPAATAYFWLLLLMLLYTQRWRRSCWLLPLVALPALFLHEAMVFLAPLLMTAAATRWRRTQASGWRVLYVLLLVYFLFATMLALQHIIEPRSVSNRSGFLSMLLSFKWYLWQDGGYNIPAMLSVFGLPLMFLLWLPWRYPALSLPRRHAVLLAVVLTTLYSVFAATLLLLQAQQVIQYSVFAQFAARAHAALVSFPLGIMLLLSCNREDSGQQLYLRAIAVLLLVICVTSCLSHVQGLQRWQAFVQAYRETLQQGQGYISWQQAFSTVPHMYELGSAWTNPLMSLFLSPQGKVTAIIDNRHPQRKVQIFDPCSGQDLPQSVYFDFSTYRQQLQTGVCRGQAQRYATAAEFPALSFTATGRLPGVAASSGWQPSPQAVPDRAGWRMQGGRARLELDRPLPQQFELTLQLATWGRSVGDTLMVRSGGSEASLQLIAGNSQYRLLLSLLQPTAAIEFVLPAWSPDATSASSAAPIEEAVGVALFRLDIDPVRAGSAGSDDS